MAKGEERDDGADKGPARTRSFPFRSDSRSLSRDDPRGNSGRKGRAHAGDLVDALDNDHARQGSRDEAGQGALRRFMLRRRSRFSGAGYGDARWQGLGDAVVEALAAGRGLPWASLAFILGIAGYFALPAEPSAGFLIAFSGGLGVLVLRGRRRGEAALLLLLGALVVSGLATGALRTVLVAAPVLERARTVTLEGFVATVEETESGVRLEVAVVAAKGLRADVMPERVRVTVRSRLDAPLRVADGVRVRARLMPPPGAVMPGSYDYSFRAFFDGIGATGFAFGAPQRVDLGTAPLLLRLKAGLGALRMTIAGRVQAALGETVAGALAVALIVGDRTAIPPDVTEVLRTAGLAHILAISGLHMALFSGAVFFVARAGLALSRKLADEQPIDIWASGAALAAATFYLLVSGTSVATQRAFAMTVLVLLGRLVGRRALTLRNAALAALVILVATPEALLDPGFQMSFAAVVALIAAYEELLARRTPARREPDGGGAGVTALAVSGLRVSTRWLGAILLTSLIAGTATGAIGAYHFHRVAPLGPLVNLLAMPVVTLVVMPFAVLSLALMPLGLELLPLAAMGAGLDLVVAMSRWAAERTPGDGIVGAPSLIATLLVVTTGALLCLAPRGTRKLAGVPLALAIWLQSVDRHPDMLIAENGRHVALRDPAGRLMVTARPTGFAGEMWLRADGVGPKSFAERHLTRGRMNCDALGCVATAHAATSGPPLVVALTRAAEGLAEDCERADILVTPLQAPTDCAARWVFDGPRLARDGATALYFDVDETAAEPGREEAATLSVGTEEPARPARQGSAAEPGQRSIGPPARVGVSLGNASDDDLDEKPPGLAGSLAAISVEKRAGRPRARQGEGGQTEGEQAEAEQLGGKQTGGMQIEESGAQDTRQRQVRADATATPMRAMQAPGVPFASLSGSGAKGQGHPALRVTAVPSYRWRRPWTPSVPVAQ
jgi:competence protein ComEC